MMSKHSLLIACLLAALAASAASAQLLGGPVGGITGPATGTIGQIGNTVGQTVGDADEPIGRQDQSAAPSPAISLGPRRHADGNRLAAPPTSLPELRKLRLEALIRANRATLDRDGDGQPARKGELIVVDPDAAWRCPRQFGQASACSATRRPATSACAW